MGVDQPFIDEVNLWNGKTNLQADEDFGEEPENDDAMEEDKIPLPPVRVGDAYPEATTLLYKSERTPAARFC